MARITDRRLSRPIPNRFELTLAATNRARQITAGLRADGRRRPRQAHRHRAARDRRRQGRHRDARQEPGRRCRRARALSASAPLPSRPRPGTTERMSRDRGVHHGTWATTSARTGRRARRSARSSSPKSAHRGQFRKSGEPYITHPLAVASILSQWRLDAQGLAAALLHDVMEDTSVTKTELETTFGKPVADMVDGVSKLDQIEFDSRARRRRPRASARCCSRWRATCASS